MPWRHTPRWITIGGGWLALTAGFVNAIGYLGIAQRGVSHVTGQVTQFGIDLSLGNGKALSAAWLIASFFIGATLSGVVIQRPELSLKLRRYGIALVLESALLTVGALVLRSAPGWGEDIVALAMGLQNGFASSYSGAIVRTTHVTGVVTDLGMLLGQALRGTAIERARVKLLSVLFFSFATGAVLGAAAFAKLGDRGLFIPAAGAGLVGIAWLLAISRAGPPRAPVARQ